MEDNSSKLLIKQITKQNKKNNWKKCDKYIQYIVTCMNIWRVNRTTDKRFVKCQPYVYNNSSSGS